jgi:acetyl-CoA acetyltransferase
VLEAGLCKAVVISYGHDALSGGGMQRMFLERAADEGAFGYFGANSGYAMAARRAMCTFKTGPETWKHIAVGQRKWANLNPEARLHDRPLTYEDYLRSDYLVEPFRLPDHCLITDGGRACIVTSLERARDLPHPPAVIMGMGMDNPSAVVPQARYLAGPTGARIAGETAFRMAGITPNDVAACEIYDCFTYTVEVTLQDYGFFGPGEGEAWFQGGTIEPGGRMPVNTSGGQLAEAYTMGLTPITEGAMQIMGRCGRRQLGPATGTRTPGIIVCSDNGGMLQSHCCLVLGRV